MERHATVLLDEAVRALNVRGDSIIVDGTIGGAGHFSALLESLNGSGTLIGIDADGEAIARAQKAAEGSTSRVELVHDNFRNLDAILTHLGIKEINGAMFDLGWSAYHLECGRGFSFKADEPLLMTYGEPEEGKSAADVINGHTERELADIFYTLGEERFARHIARGIVEAREKARILTSAELASIIEESVPGWYRRHRIHPATKSFQALRIYVNDELNALREGLSAAFARLAPYGRIAVITFHSLEDRIVKTMLREASHNGEGVVLTKKPAAPSDEECARNPRARSAKLRIFEKAGHAGVSADSLSTFSHAV